MGAPRPKQSIPSLIKHSFQRGKKTQTPSCSLLKLEGVDSTEAAKWYAGKRVACMYNWVQDMTKCELKANGFADVYRAQKAIQGSKTRVIWGS